MKLRLKWIMLGEVSIVLIALGILAYGNNPESIFAHIGAVFTALVLLHSAYIPLYGLNFVIHDAPPDSPAKYYWFVCIGVGVFVGTGLAKDFFELAQRIV